MQKIRLANWMSDTKTILIKHKVYALAIYSAA